MGRVVIGLGLVISKYVRLGAVAQQLEHLLCNRFGGPRFETTSIFLSLSFFLSFFLERMGEGGGEEGVIWTWLQIILLSRTTFANENKEKHDSKNEFVQIKSKHNLNKNPQKKYFTYSSPTHILLLLAAVCVLHRTF